MLVELQAAGSGGCRFLRPSRVLEDVRQVDEGVTAIDDEVGLFRQCDGLTRELLCAVEPSAPCQHAGLDAAPEHLREQIASRRQLRARCASSSASSTRPCAKTARARNAAVVDRKACSPICVSASNPARRLASAAAGSPASISITASFCEVAAFNVRPEILEDARCSCEQRTREVEAPVHRVQAGQMTQRERLRIEIAR